MTNTIGDEFARRATDHDEKLKYQPEGDAPVVTAPDLERYHEVNAATDRALADEFFRRYRHLFCNGDGNLYIFHPERAAWSRDNVQQQVLGYCMHLSDRFYEELAVVTEALTAARAAGADDVEQLARRQQALTKMILHCEKGNTMGTIARLLSAKLTTVMADKPVKMNANPALLAVANGVVDLTDGRLLHGRAEDYITRNTNVVYKNDIDTKWWEDTVLSMCGGNPRLAEFLQVWAGYCATGFTREHCMAILWGSGRNGKNLLIDSVAQALGGYASSLPAAFLESMGNQSNMDNNMLFAMAQLDGIRMAYVSETGERGKMKESWVKSQTGDRMVRARLARQDYYEFPLTHKLVVGTNHKPEVTGTDDGVWERIRMVPMRVRFGTEAEVEAGIAQQLADRALLGKTTDKAGAETVLRWIVVGAGKFLKHGLRRYTPPEIVAETLGYRREQDVMGQFLQDATDWIDPAEVLRVQSVEGQGSNRVYMAMSLDERLRVEKQEFWRTYAVWCDEHGHMPLSSTKFGQKVTAAQRFWQDDIGGEKLMRPIELTKAGNTWFLRYVRLSENGVRLRNIARSRLQSIAKQDLDHGDE
jgi:P4 family phage/plasmid primase-like protien